MLSDLDSDNKITACIVCAGVLVFRCGQSFPLYYAVAQVLEKRGEQ